jgi:hypothetical protein
MLAKVFSYAVIGLERAVAHLGELYPGLGQEAGRGLGDAVSSWYNDVSNRLDSKELTARYRQGRIRSWKAAR